MIYAVMILVRFLFGETVIRFIRLIDRRPSQRLRRTNLRQRAVNTVAGFRGAISLAVAFSIPTTLGSGPFPGRDIAMFITSGVVLLSLIVQGLLLPTVVRWFQANPGPNVNTESSNEHEERKALLKSTQDLIQALPSLAEENNISAKAMERVRSEYRMNASVWATELHENEDQESQARAQLHADEHRLRVVAAQYSRERMIELRDSGDINDESLMRLLRRIDLEELRITGPVEME